MSDHFRRLERMYLAAPINEIYKPRIQVSEGSAEIQIDVGPKYHHAGHAVHGSVYFKMLDDAAFFAANSLEGSTFVLTSSFTSYLVRPIVEGSIRSVGRVVHQTKSQFVAESVLYDLEDRQLARGSGVFVRGKWLLTDAAGYPDAPKPG